MFLTNDFYKKLSGILLEAEDDEIEDSKEQTSNYRLGDDSFEDGEAQADVPEEESTTDDTGSDGGLTEEDLDDQTNSYTLGDDSFEDGEESQEDDAVEGEEEIPEGTDENGEELTETDEQNDNNEISKKYMLASQYKEILLIINNLEKSMNNEREAETDPEKIHYIYIVIEKINNLKSKINYYIINNFITRSYEDLLSSFLFLKRELELIISLIEKLTEGKEE